MLGFPTSLFSSQRCSPRAYFFAARVLPSESQRDPADRVFTFINVYEPTLVGLSKVFRADGRLVNMSGVFCTNNAQAPSLFSHVTLTYCFNIRSTSCVCSVSVTLKKREGACALFVQKTPDLWFCEKN